MLQVLGIKPDADQLEIMRSYNRKLYENRNNAQGKKRVEEAHGRLMLSAFNARLKASCTGSSLAI